MEASANVSLQLDRVVLERAAFSHRPDWPGIAPKLTPILEPATVGVETNLTESLDKLLVRISLAVPLGKGDYAIEVVVAGEFTLLGDGDRRQQMPSVIRASVSIVFPFLREAISNLTVKGAFGAALVQPMNVAAAINTEELVPDLPDPTKAASP